MSERVFTVFLSVWVVLGVAGFFLFYVNRNVAFKRKYYVPYSVGAGILFLAFTVAMGAPLDVLALMIPAVALVIYLSIQGTRFCEACGRTVLQAFPLPRARFCSKCGAPLA